MTVSVPPRSVLLNKPHGADLKCSSGTPLSPSRGNSRSHSQRTNHGGLGYPSDSDLEDAGHVKVAAKSRVHPRGPLKNSMTRTRDKEGVGKGKIVKIPDIAFVT